MLRIQDITSHNGGELNDFRRLLVVKIVIKGTGTKFLITKFLSNKVPNALNS
jgi:hypothetical protein